MYKRQVKGLVSSALEVKYEPAILQAVEAVNERQKSVLGDKLRAVYSGELRGKTFALWGLSLIHISEPTRPY